MGFVVRVIERAGALRIVERRNTRTGAVHWEVWRMQERAAGVAPDGTSVPAGEYPPKTSEWGEYGWTYTSLSDALQKCRSLQAGIAERRLSRPVNGPVAPPP